ncbi:MAG: DUF6794 domain-containing protein [Planctomycetota bacterium]|jgi:hypothetical protein
MSEADDNTEGQRAKTHGLSLWSLGLGIYALITFPISIFCEARELFLFTAPIATILALIFAIISLIKIRKSKGLLKGKGFAIVGILFSLCAPFLFYLTVEYVYWPAHSVSLNGIYLDSLYRAMSQYSQENLACYPPPENWCDLLMKQEGKHSDWLRKEYYHYALNPYCEPNSPNNVVLLFEAEKGWNQFGGSELMEFGNRKGIARGCLVLLNDGSVRLIKQEQVSELKWGGEGKAMKDEVESDAEGLGEGLPRTYEEAVAELLAVMSAEDKRSVQSTPKDDLIEFHFGWGMGIRNDFGLWGGSNKQLLESCAKRSGVEHIHPDDASMLIIEGVWEALQSEEDE